VVKTTLQTSVRISPLLLLLTLLLAACQPIAAVSAVNASVVTSTTALAAPNQEQCTLATLKGRYLFATSGTLLPPAFGVTEPTPGASAGFHLFNGDGTGTDTVTLRVGSKIVMENAVVPFTYTVKPDCTGRSSVPNGPSFDLFIDPKGEAIAVIATAPPGNYASRIEQRVSSK